MQFKSHRLADRILDRAYLLQSVSTQEADLDLVVDAKSGLAAFAGTARKGIGVLTVHVPVHLAGRLYMKSCKSISLTNVVRIRMK